MHIWETSDHTFIIYPNVSYEVEREHFNTNWSWKSPATMFALCKLGSKTYKQRNENTVFQFRAN